MNSRNAKSAGPDIDTDKRSTMGALSALAIGCAAPGLVMAKKPWPPKRLVDRENIFNQGVPSEVNGGPLKLPAWPETLKNSSWDTSVLMFRGNPTHTFYGTGTLRERLEIQWSHRMIDFPTTLRGRKSPGVALDGLDSPSLMVTMFLWVRSVEAFMPSMRRRALFDGDWRKRMFKSSPCLYQNRIYVACVDDLLRCIDAATGHVIWAVHMLNDCDSSPCIVDDKVYICGESGHARCLDPRTGKIHWETYLGGTGPGTKPGSNGIETSPAISNGELFAGSFDGRLFCVDIATGKVKWTANTGDDTDASPVVTDDFVYAAAEEKASKLYCFDRSKKGRKLWSFDANPYGYWSTPALVNDTLYIGGQNNYLYSVDAKTGREIWSYRTGAAIWSSPAVLNGRVVFGSYDSHLYVLDAKRGRLLNRIRLDGKCLATPIIDGGRVYVGTGAEPFTVSLEGVMFASFQHLNKRLRARDLPAIATAAVASATTAAATTTSAAATATAATAPVVCLVHSNGSSIQLCSVHFGLSFSARCVLYECHEAEPSGSTSFSIGNYLSLDDFAESLECFTKGIVSRSPA